MSLDLFHDCTFTGPALPEPFVKLNLETDLNRLGLLPKTVGVEGKKLEELWTLYRRKLRNLIAHGGGLRVQNHVIEPLLGPLGYARIEDADEVQTREGAESGGALLLTEDGSARLRVWCVDLNQDLDTPARRGLAYRFSHLRIAQRVLLVTGERLGLITNGFELRLVISDPARIDSQVTIAIDPHWKRSRELPDSFRLLLALGNPSGVRALPEIIEKARLQQAKVTKDLREQARSAIREFIQEVLDHPANQTSLRELPDKAALAKNLWHEGLITVYRLLFILKLESTDDPARSFSFSSSALWRNTFSPSVALAPHVRAVLDRGGQSGQLLARGLLSLFRMFAEGLQCTELNVRPMAGALFTASATPILSSMEWSEYAVAKLLDNLLWTKVGRGVTSRERVHYGPLDVEDLGRVYEALLELEPGISSQPMCRLRRAKLEVVVPADQGEKYRPNGVSPRAEAQDEENDNESDSGAPEEEEEGSRDKKTKVEWVEEIPSDRFYLRVGFGRKATGSFYTPHSFVRFLVQETIGPLVERVSPQENPQPCAVLKLKVIDKAMGSGHFLVEACRFLGERVYDAARRCDELASAKERLADAASLTETEREVLLDQGTALRQRVIDLPDPDDELLRYLPSRSPEGRETGFSQSKARALCRRMVAVHCLYGVDKNPLAVELAKLALWIECHAEGLPLTFLDHRLVVGDSLTGPFFDQLLKYPGSQQPLNDLFTRGLTEKLSCTLADALQHVRALESTVGVTVAEIEAKQAAKARLDHALMPFKILAAAWSGGVMLGPDSCDDTAYAALAKLIAETGKLPDDWLSTLGNRPTRALFRMVAKGLGLPGVSGDAADFQSVLACLSVNTIPAHSFDLAFPEVFYPDANLVNRVGFDADLGNPPWDAVRRDDDQFFGSIDFRALSGATKKEKKIVQSKLLEDSQVETAYSVLVESFKAFDRIADVLFDVHKAKVDGQLAGRGTYDLYMLFAARSCVVLRRGGITGCVLPSAFHANEGATGLRRLYLSKMKLICCYSYENLRKLFEIDNRLKFAVLVAQQGEPTVKFECAFYLHEDQWLFSDRKERPPLSYSLNFVQKTGGEYLSFLEIRSQADLEASETCFSNSHSFSDVTSEYGIQLSQELNMTYDVDRFVSTDEMLARGSDPREPTAGSSLLASGYLPLHEGKTFWHYDECWGDRPRYLVSLAEMRDKADILRAARHYRLAFRAIQNAQNERTLTLVLVPPGRCFGNSAPSDRTPFKSRNWQKLLLLAVSSAYPPDWLLRLKATANINLFILEELPLPRTGELQHRFLAHSALRLICNHASYAPLWREQLGEAWREAGPAFTWPVLAGDDARWAVRAAIDAVVAYAYGLTRDQYAHVLSTFSHSSYKDAPRLCLAAFDELQSIGLEAFTKKHDLYSDIPLNENLPEPVIQLPVPGAADGRGSDSGSAEGPQALFEFQATPVTRGGPGSFAQPSKSGRRGKANRPL